MKNRVAALAHDDKTGLNNIRLMDDLLGRMAQDDIRFEFNFLLLRDFRIGPKLRS